MKKVSKMCFEFISKWESQRLCKGERGIQSLEILEGTTKGLTNQSHVPGGREGCRGSNAVAGQGTPSRRDTGAEIRITTGRGDHGET